MDNTDSIPEVLWLEPAVVKNTHMVNPAVDMTNWVPRFMLWEGLECHFARSRGDTNREFQTLLAKHIYIWEYPEYKDADLNLNMLPFYNMSCTYMRHARLLLSCMSEKMCYIK
jgi:hypothetical protein